MVGRGLPLLAGLLALAACVDGRKAEDPDWYAPAEGLDVTESAFDFTDQPYAFPAAGDPAIADLPEPPEYTTWFGQGDAPPDGCGDWAVDDALPIEVEGMVTIHPRIYIKIGGCVPDNNFDVDSDEKYYGSFFIEDSSGGIFVLGDSKVAHFDMGDRVKMKVRATKNNFGLKMVAAHDILEIERGPEPIFYTETTEEFETLAEDPGQDPVGKVMRVTGTVASDPDTFGEFLIEGDQGQIWAAGLDVELNRRGVRYPVGSRIEVTAPILYSFSTYTLIIMKIGQVRVLEE